MKVENYLKQHKEKNIWKTFVALAACVVAFFTIFLLTKPAITMKGELICGIEDHEHIASCYKEVEEEITYTCGMYEHTHLPECYLDNGELFCLQDEHTHIESCYPIENTTDEAIEEIEQEIEEVEVIADEVVSEEIVEADTTQIATVDTSVQPKRFFSFADWIKNIFIHHSSDNGYTWNDVSNNEVKKDDIIKFSIDYDVPPNTLDYTNNTIEYAIPSSIKIDKEASGYVNNKQGEEVGTYVIGTDGLIHITFNDYFVEKNMSGQIINGNILFEADVDNIAKNEAGDVVINFTSDIILNLEVVDLVDNTPDLQVEKSYSNLDVDNGTIEYTIVVTSQSGTGKEITLYDEMRDNIGYLDSFSVVDSNGNAVGVTYPNTGDSNFTLILPKLEANGSYTIRYKAKLNSHVNGTKDVANQAKVSSTNNNDYKLEDEVTVYSRFSKNMVIKSATQSNTEDTIDWTITINPDKSNISGYILKDIYRGSTYTGKVTLTDSSGNSSIITFPYTFPDTSDTYTVTYQTTKDRNPGEQNIINIATLISPDGKEYVSEKSVYTQGDYGGVYKPITKSYEDYKYNHDKKRFEINWKLNLSAKNGTLIAPFTINDRVENYQYFDKVQLLSVVAQLNNAGLSYDILIDGQYGINDLTDDGRYSAFKITVNENFTKGSSVDIHYTTYVDSETDDVNKEYTNVIKFNDLNEDYITIKVSPVVRKMDAINNTSANPSSNECYGNTGTELDEGILSWRIYVNIPKNTTGNVILEEILPENVDLTYIKMDVASTFSQEFTQDGNNWNLYCNGHTVNATLNENVLTMNIPESLNIQKEITLNLKVKIKDNVEWTDESISFSNTVNVKNKEGEIIGTAEQTQNITKGTSPEDAKQILNKYTELTSNTTDIIPYVIEVNSNGADLISGIDVLTVKDTMTYPGGSSYATIGLVPNSVKVYRKLADGELVELSSDDFSYKYTSVVPEGDGWLTCQNLLDFTVPDSTPLVIKYKYKIYGEKGVTLYNIKNSSSILNMPGNPATSGTISNIIISQSSATATVGGIKIVKVDKDNYSITIPGVVFNLYKWNGSDYEQVLTEDGNTNFITDSHGEIELSKMIPNVAYKLVEVVPAAGYQNTGDTYFIINNTDTDTYPIIKPNTFRGSTIVDGIALNIENSKPATKVSVNKKWVDANGNSLNDTPSSVTVRLKRYAIPESLYETLPKKSLNFTIGPDPYLYWEDIIKNYAVGARVRLKIDYTSYSWVTNVPEVKFNGNILENVAIRDDNYADGDSFVFEFTISEDSTLSVVTNESNQEFWKYSFEVIEKGELGDIDYSEYIDESFNKSTNLSLTGNWSHTWTNLPLLGKNSNGESVDYVYFVTEDSVYGYKTEITKDEYNFTVTNKLEGIKETYELPATGGIGLYYYFIFVFAFIGLLLIGLKVNNKI